VATSLEEAVRPEDLQSHQQWHSSVTPSVMGVGAVYHGQDGEQYRNQQEDLLFYLRQIDEGVRRVVQDPKAPLVLAATETVVAHYRKASEHPHLLAEYVHGNPDHVKDDVLYQHALPYLEDKWHREIHQTQEQFGAAAARNLASKDISQIVPAAAEGRVGVLIVPKDLNIWGKVESDTGRVLSVEQSSSESVDLVDEAALRTLLSSGQVFLVEPEEVPGGGELAAIYRY
jgi:hypothetical protein